MTTKFKFHFKKFYVIDFLLLFIVLSILGIAILWFKRTKERVTIVLEAEPIAFSQRPIPPLFWLANQIQDSDKIFNEFGQEVGVVSHVNNVDFGSTFRFLRLHVELDTLYDTRTGLYRYGNQRLRIGDTISLTIGNVKFTGQIKKISNEAEKSVSEEQRKFILKLHLRSVPLGLVNSYDENFQITDENNHQIFRIRKVNSVQPAKNLITELANGTIQLQESERHRDVEMEVEVMTSCQKGVCFFNEDQPIKIGLQLWVENNRSFISGAEILEILNEEEVNAN
jgi:hypothetical protein